MSATDDPTQALRSAAAAYPDAVVGTSCNQTSYKAGKKAYLYVGPGPKGVGYKAMFKLDESLDEAAALANNEPGRFEVGSNHWVTARFTDDAPLPEALWTRWLEESHNGAI